MKNNRLNKSIWVGSACLVVAAALLANSVWIQAKAHLAQYLIADAWAATQRDNRQQTAIVNPHLPWSWADTHPVAQLRVPTLGVEQYVLNGANGSPLAFAPGLYTGTALPQSTSIHLPDPVIAGHHDTHFAFLKRLNIGDIIQLENHRGESIHYTVSQIQQRDIRQHRLPVFKGGQTLQLVTCVPSFIGEVHPDGRLLVIAHRISAEKKLLTQR